MSTVPINRRQLKPVSASRGGIPANKAYFGSVWAYFPRGTGDVHIGRFRPPVRRHIYCSEQFFSESDEDFSA